MVIIEAAIILSSVAKYGVNSVEELLENKPATISRDETCGESSWQESDQSDNFDRRSKFLEISSTTYIENKQYIEF